MQAEILFKRESLFPFDKIELLKSEKLGSLRSIIHTENELSELRRTIEEQIKFAKQRLYAEGRQAELKLLMRLKGGKLLVNEKKRSDLRQYPALQDTVALLDEYALKAEALVSLRREIEEEFRRPDPMDTFFENEFFREALKYTNADFYEQGLGKKSKNGGSERTKRSRLETRYNYVQRATVKTSPLSHFGVTTYRDAKSAEVAKYGLNTLIKTLLLQAVSMDENRRHRLTYTFSPIVRDADDRVIGLYFEKQMLHRDFGWLLKQEDILHQKVYVALNENMQEGSAQLSYAELERLVGEEKRIDIDSLIANNIAVPAYGLYLNDDALFLGLVEELFGTSWRDRFQSAASGTLKRNDPGSELIGYIADKLASKYPVDLPAMLNKMPLFYHNVIRREDFDFPVIPADRQKKLLSEFLSVNEQGRSIRNYIQTHHARFAGSNLLEIICMVKQDLLDRSFDHTAYQYPSVPDQKKNMLLFFQLDQASNLVLNNIASGSGHLIARDADAFSPELAEQYRNHCRRIFTRPYPVYEVVIDEEISNKIDVGKSNLPQVKWPADFARIRTALTEDGELCFEYRGERVNLTYQGTVPFHLFQGAKRILMDLIHPWKVEYAKIKSYNVPFRPEYELKLDQLEIGEERPSDAAFAEKLTRLFEQGGYPFDFFIKEKKEGFALPGKPVWMSLHSPVSIKLLRKMLEEGKTFGVTGVFPNAQAYGENGRCVEYGQFIVEGDEHVV
ncbi:hypothetical protein [Saccharibacillus sacchari]|uniref:Uncharacterized protein n=1 Tax=Saccharibacillus sacchari TaxID=456493 RepID=A0ACC6PAI7_9BACL